MKTAYYKVEKNVPLPGQTIHYGGMSQKAFLLALKRGESFLVPKEKKNSIVVTGCKLKRKLCTKKLDSKSWRVWVIK